MKILLLPFFIIFCFLTGCTAPVYQNTTYGIEEFTSDAQQIAQGKSAILAWEEHETACCPQNETATADTIIEGDELSITLYCPQRSDRMDDFETMHNRAGFRVCDGQVCLPHLPPLFVQGLSLQEAREAIQAAYCEQISDTQIYINFRKKRERLVQIIGANQSMIAVDNKTRLSEVLAKAQISPYANLFKSYVMRDGRQLLVDMYALIHDGDECQNIVMQGGDQIFIANTSDATIMVTGEVGHSIVIPIPYGRISLREALVFAGGIPYTGAKDCIHVIRGDLTRPKIYALKWSEIAHYSNRNLLLMPGDIVVVAEKPITQWNRFISQLQLSAFFVQSGGRVYHRW